MNYEIAKKLKDAGFKFGDVLTGIDLLNSFSQWYWHCKNDCEGEVYSGDDTAVGMKCKKCKTDIIPLGKTPKLKELIDACGSRFGKLEFVPLEESNGVAEWRAYARDNSWKTAYETPEEAVANLWLKLNENNK